MQKELLKFFILLMTIGFLTKGVVLAGQIPRQQTIGSSQMSEAIIKLTNIYRQEAGLKPLLINPRLTQAAINKANDIITNQYFSHTSPEGKRFSDWIKEVNYSYFYSGENLAIDFTSAEDAFSAWLKSDKHRQNIERSEFQEIGVASISGKFNGRQTTVIVQLFGSRVLGANDFSDYPSYQSLANNYFSQSKTAGHINWNLLANFMMLGGLIGFLFVILNSQTTIATIAIAEPGQLMINDNKQRYLKNDVLGISIIRQSLHTRQLAKQRCQEQITANQLHRQKKF